MLTIGQVSYPGATGRGAGGCREGIELTRLSTLLCGIRPVFGARQSRIVSSGKNLKNLNG
jgi:hypothetical protein